MEKTKFASEQEALDYIFRSIAKTLKIKRGLDEDARDTTPTRRLLSAEGLLDTHREYIVVTGSKGKGSTAIMTAKILECLGHTVGLVTSPHLINYRERIRVNGRAIPEADFLRILSDLSPQIDAVEATLTGDRYFSPQGIFLAMALRWFDEQDVDVAVMEVGRGGRFDDMALVPNRVSLFSPIVLEHTRYLGDSLERIGWHKAGIIKPNSYAYSVPQDPDVLQTIMQESDAQDAEFYWFSPLDMGEFIEETANGIRFRLGRYGEIDMPLLGRYEIANATLAVQGAGNVHGRMKGLGHGSPEYVACVQTALETVYIPGRLEKLQDNPTVYVDGAINLLSAQSFVESVKKRLTSPVVTVLAVPRDRNVAGVYEKLALISDALVLTESTRNITIHYPDADDALQIAHAVHDDVTHTATLADALEVAKAKAGTDGMVLIVGGQPTVGDALELYGRTFEQI